jgi:hypothetical protein
MVWQSFTTVVTLGKVMRQDETEVQLKNVLERLRMYSSTREDCHWLQGYQWHNITQKYGQDVVEQMAKNALFAFPTHQDEWEHNKSQLLVANQHHPIAKITADCQGIHSKSSSAVVLEGSSVNYTYCKTARVNLTVNINVKYALYNGAVGTVVDIVYPEGLSPSDGGFPEFVVVDFPKYTGPPWMEDHPTWIPVCPVERRLDCHCCKRILPPLRPGFGTTIHRVQGKH